MSDATSLPTRQPQTETFDSRAAHDSSLYNEDLAPVPVSRRTWGTSNYAAYLTVSDALDFQDKIGGKAKEARLRHLRNRWAEALRGHNGLEILTPDDPRLVCGITSFRLRGQTTSAQNRAVVADLLKRFNIFTVERSNIASGAAIRVTPSVYTSESDVDQLIVALKSIA